MPMAKMLVLCAIAAALPAMVFFSQAPPAPVPFSRAARNGLGSIAQMPASPATEANHRRLADMVDTALEHYPAMPKAFLNMLDSAGLSFSSKVMQKPASLEATEKMTGEKQEASLHARMLYYGLAIVLTAGIASALASMILIGGNRVKGFLQQKGWLGTYTQLPQGEDLGASRGFVREKVMAVSLFCLHILVAASLLWPAALAGELSGNEGLSYRRWMEALMMGLTWQILQAMFRTISTRKVEHFSPAVGPMSTFTYMCPFVSDGYDSFKDVIFSAVCVGHGGIWRMIGVLSLLWLMAVHIVLVTCDGQAEAADTVLATYASIIYASVVTENTQLEKWEEAVMILYKQATVHKRNLILLEDFPQGVACLAYVVTTRNTAGFPYFVFINNVVLPFVKFLFAAFCNKTMAKEASQMLFKQAKIALESANLAKFNSLMAVLVGHETRLTLNEWGLGDDGAASVAKALESPNCAVQKVNLYDNKIGPDGATAIGKAPTCSWKLHLSIAAALL